MHILCWTAALISRGKKLKHLVFVMNAPSCLFTKHRKETPSCQCLWYLCPGICLSSNSSRFDCMPAPSTALLSLALQVTSSVVNRKCHKKGMINDSVVLAARHMSRTSTYPKPLNPSSVVGRKKTVSPVMLACCLGAGGGAGFFFLFSFSKAFLSCTTRAEIVEDCRTGSS